MAVLRYKKDGKWLVFPMISQEERKEWNSKADGETVDNHINDTEAHVTQEERKEWNSKADGETVDNHINDTEVHVTAEEKETWDGKAEAEHTHTSADITDLQGKLDEKAASSHNQSASTITEGTLAGKVLANATAKANLGDLQVRNIKASTADLTAGSSSLATGDIYLVYE